MVGDGSEGSEMKGEGKGEENEGTTHTPRDPCGVLAFFSPFSSRSFSFLHPFTGNRRPSRDIPRQPWGIQCPVCGRFFILIPIDGLHWFWQGGGEERRRGEIANEHAAAKKRNQTQGECTF